MNIGTGIKWLREQKGLTQEALGNIIGVNKATINRYETGEIDIRRTTAIKLGNALNVPPAQIMGWTNTYESNGNLLINRYNQLNSLGQQKADEYINDLLENPKYNREETSHTPTLADYGTIAACGGGVKPPKKKPRIT